MSTHSQVNRQSNIELLRIIAMMVIIFHHYCVHGGFFNQFDFQHITANTILIQCFSLGGKIGVNIFFLITGYFMIHKNMKVGKIWKLIYQIFTINIIVCIFLLLMGESYSKKDFLAVIPLISDVPISFISNYVMVYLLSPIINKCLRTLTRKEFEYLLLVLLCYYSVLNSFFFQNTFQYATWAFVMYSVGAYIRIYKFGLNRKWRWGWIAICIILLCWIGMVSADYLEMIRGKSTSGLWSMIYTNANKVTVFCASVSIFLYFARLKIKHSRLINYMGGGALLGVLLFHDNGWPMRRWLWTKFLHTDSYYTSDYLWLHMLVSVILIFITCIFLEKIRSRLFDKSFDHFYKRYTKGKGHNINSIDL